MLLRQLSRINSRVPCIRFNSQFENKSNQDYTDDLNNLKKLNEIIYVKKINTFIEKFDKEKLSILLENMSKTELDEFAKRASRPYWEMFKFVIRVNAHFLAFMLLLDTLQKRINFHS